MAVARVTEIISGSPKGFKDAIEQGVERANKTLKNVEGEGDFVCTHAFCRAKLRSALCFTISSAQGRTKEGTIGLYDLSHPRYSLRHLYTCCNRARAFDKLSCKD